MSLDPFWAAVDRQLDRIAEEKPHTFAAVAEILPAEPGVSAGPAFFAGSGGDRQLDEALLEAGWRYLSTPASYHYSMVSPTGEKLTYVEGDVYPGNQLE